MRAAACSSAGATCFVGNENYNCDIMMITVKVWVGAWFQIDIRRVPIKAYDD